MNQERPIPISRIGGSYYLFHAPSIAYIRSSYRIPGLLTGTLPQASQQNVFFGLPLQLMPEEARVLVEKGVAFVVDECSNHRQTIRGLEADRTQENGQKAQWIKALHDVGLNVAEELQTKRKAEKSRAIDQMNQKAQKKRASRAREKDLQGAMEAQQKAAGSLRHEEADNPLPEETGFFQATTTAHAAEDSESTISANIPLLQAHSITPTTSHPPISPPSPPGAPPSSLLPAVSRSYPLFKHLHDKEYFLSPGLRFGCQYVAYPGDPLRFHSHFMVIGRGWDEEVDLLSIVGLGRLATGVKKGVLLGGVGHTRAGKKEHGHTDEVQDDCNVRCFCIEWGGM